MAFYLVERACRDRKGSRDAQSQSPKNRHSELYTAVEHSGN